jgi:hypothetical protein
MAEVYGSSVRHVVINGPSFRARLMWWVVKLILPLLMRPPPIPPKGPQVWDLPPSRLRKQIAAGAVAITDWHEETSGWHIPILRARSPSFRNPAPRVVFYFHGGSFTWSPSPNHWEWMAWMSDKLDAEFYVVPYPLAPTNTALEVRRNLCLEEYWHELTEHVHSLGHAGPPQYISSSSCTLRKPRDHLRRRQVNCRSLTYFFF